MTSMKVFVFCMRVKDKPEPAIASKKMPCTRCGADCWVAPSSEEIIETRKAKVVCLKCANTKVFKKQKGVAIGVTGRQMNELAEYYAPKQAS